MTKKIARVLLIVCGAMVLSGSFQLFSYYQKIAAQERALQDVLAQKAASDDGEQGGTGAAEKSLLPEYRQLWINNSDLIGWIKIAGTRIDYPVMTQRENEYYLAHNFSGQPSPLGLPFVIEGETELWHDPQKSIFVYGHNVKSGAMFHDLLEFAQAEFLAENNLISFDTLYEKRTYRVISTVSFIDQDTEIDRLKSETDLLVLITCSYHHEDGRFAVIARRVD